ncbi:MAG: hypothetical protein ACFCGT_08510 [Sandaracinaceae bacterium]
MAERDKPDAAPTYGSPRTLRGFPARGQDGGPRPEALRAAVPTKRGLGVAETPPRPETPAEEPSVELSRSLQLEVLGADGAARRRGAAPEDARRAAAAGPVGGERNSATEVLPASQERRRRSLAPPPSDGPLVMVLGAIVVVLLLLVGLVIWSIVTVW